MKALFLILGLMMTLSLFAVPRDCVVVEVVTGTWCQYCPGAAMGVDDLIDNGKRVAVIEYHGGDTFQTNDSAGRINYYNVTGYPTAFFDGMNAVEGGDHSNSLYDSYLPRYNSRINVASNYSLAVSGSCTGDNYNLAVTVTKASGVTASNLRLHVVLTESDMAFNWQGQTHLNFVERLMLPNYNGTSITFPSGDIQTANFSFTMNPEWVANNCQLVIFLQNNSTKEIYQGTRATLGGISNAFPVSENHIDFGDEMLTGSATHPIRITNYWNQTITGTLESSNPAFTINGSANILLEIPPFGTLEPSIIFSPTAIGTVTGSLQILTDLSAYPNITIPLTGTGFGDQPPTVTGLTISGPPVIQQTLTASYQFADPDNDTEGASQYSWYQVDNGVYTQITGQSEITYHPQSTDIGKQIAFQIIPVDEHGMNGTTYRSDPSQVVIDIPAPRNLTAEVAENDVTLTWQPPQYFGRGLLGFKIYRGVDVVTTIINAAATTYLDANVPMGTYQYSVKAVYSNPMIISASSNIVEVQITMTANEDQITPAINQTLSSYPNPSSSSTTLVYTLKQTESASLSVYDVKGRRIVTQVLGTKNAGQHAWEWNGRDEAGNTVPNGVYFCRLVTPSTRVTHKMMIMH